MPPNDPLSRTLQSWRVAPEANPHFRAGVWQRIEAMRRAGAESGGAYVRHHAAMWVLGFVVALGGSGWLGLNAAEKKNEATRQKLVAAYVQSIDPRAQVQP